MDAFDKECPRCHGQGLGVPPSASLGTATGQGVLWHYAHQGKRLGPIPLDEVKRLVSVGTITSQTMVWRQGMANWQPAQQTDLAALLTSSQQTPPPLMGEDVNNGLVWTLAFVPLFSVFLQLLLGAMLQTPASDFWWIALPLNIGLSLADEKQLKNAGHDTKGMGIWAVLLVPAYLFVRASRLHQNNSYAVVWLVTFCASLLF